MSDLAPARTPLGQLQRGLGSGFLWALEEKPSTVKPLLQQCLNDDPRWDHQVDNRGSYYGALVDHTGLGLSALKASRHREADWYTLAISVLAAQASRGSLEAVKMLLEYVQMGTREQVHTAIDDLTSMPNRNAWKRLKGALQARFQDRKDLERHLPWIDRKKPPWSEWSQLEDPLGEAIRRQRTSRRAEPRIDCESMSTDELLDRGDALHHSRRVEKCLQQRTSEEDTLRMLKAIDITRPWRALTALRVLTPRAERRVFAPAKAIIEQWRPEFNWKSGRRRRGGHPTPLRLWAVKAMQALPCDMTLPLAREWRSSRQLKLHHAAKQLMYKCVTADDLPWIRRQLGRRVTDTRVYDLCSYAEFVSRFPSHGPFPALTRIYHDFPYSYGRRFIVEAMALTDRSFSTSLAYDCLWDCEPAIRLTAVRSVDLALSGAKDRLRELARDRYEDEPVRISAKKRLAR